MYNYQDTVSYVTSSIFFIFVVIMGAFVCVNLCLASIMHQFLEQKEKDQELKAE